MSLPREWAFGQSAEEDQPRESHTLSNTLSHTHNMAGMENEVMMSGSRLSVQSAPPLEATQPARPQHLPLSQGYLQSDALEEEDNLLTISSLTARPLLARRVCKITAQTESSIDGGYGWLVVLGAFMVQFWVAGLVKSYGVLYVEVLETFPGSSAQLASLLPALLSALCLALAPLSSALCTRFSCRTVVFVGGLFCSVGLAGSYFATSLLHLLFTFGILTGIGGGLSTTPGIVIVSQYFDKHRALANGICVSGTAAGSVVFPMIIEKLVDRYGFHGTILLLGGGMLHVCVSAALYRERVLGGSSSSSSSTSQPPSRASSKTDQTLITFTSEDNRKLTLEDRVKVDNRLESLFLSDMDIYLNRKNALLTSQLSQDNILAAAGGKLPLTGSDGSLKPPPINNLITEVIHPSLIQVTGVGGLQLQRRESAESLEGGDVLGEAGRGRSLRLRPARSSGRMHSVEDLTTDSTCVYKHISRSMYIKPVTESSQQGAQNVTGQSKNKKTDVETCTPLAGLREDEELTPSDTSCISRYLDVSLLKDGRFMLMSASVVLMSSGSPYLLYYLPAHTIAVGHTKTEAGSLVAISAAMDLLGRLSLGWLCDLQIFDRKKAYLVSVVLAGAAVFCLPLITTWWQMAIASGCYGLCLGCWFLLVPVLLTDLFGCDRISSSYGLVRMFQSLGAISVPQLAGYIRDVTGGYSLCFYCMGSCMVLSALPMLAVSNTALQT